MLLSSTLRGFSLVELAVALLLTSLVVGFGLQAFHVSGRTECYVGTKAQMAEIKDAIERFSIKHDRFPMPADRAIGVDNPDFGREAAVTDLSTNNGAVFGALPFQALGIPVSNATDCWGNKFSYAVTEELTDPVKFLNNNTDGALYIKTANGNMFLDGAGYVLISHGMDQLGAVKGNYAGMDKRWCATSTELRTENCDIDDADMVAAEFNDGKDAAAAYYDDLILYRGKPWRNIVTPDECPLCWFIPIVAESQ
jgi:hypothetical protein